MAGGGVAVDPVQVAFQRPDHLADVDGVRRAGHADPAILAALGLQIAQLHQLIHHLHHVIAGHAVQGGHLGHARQLPLRQGRQIEQGSQSKIGITR
ncbi:hypothetical protein D3C72_1268030 [compost metagenome]